MKKITKEKTPNTEIPYRRFDQPFRFVSMIPGKGIVIEQDKNGVCYISAEGGYSVSDLVAGDNINIQYTEDGKIVISSVNTAVDIAAGENITIEIDPETGKAVISSIVEPTGNEHYQGIFDTPQDLMAADPNPEVGDFGLIRQVTITNGDISFNGQYKYLFWTNGAWTLVDQMLTFTANEDLINEFYSVGGSSPTIYLHKVAQTGDFWSLRNIPIVATPVVTVNGDTVTATCETEGAEIWYTTDGSMPHVNGTKYVGPITVTGATDFRFVGIKNGMINSKEATANADYGLQEPVIELDWTDGTVTMSNPNASGTIHYTTDGSTPTSDSPQYTDPLHPNPISPSTSVHFRAVVYDSGQYSPVADETYERTVLSGFSNSNKHTGIYNENWFVGVSGQPGEHAPDGKCTYTTDGETPDYNSSEMTSFVSFMRYGDPKTLKMIGFRPGFLPSEVRTKSIGYQVPSAPSITFDGETNTVTMDRSGNVTSNPAIPLATDNTNPTTDCRIYYTLDGTTPTDQSTLYSGPFQITGNVTVKAVLIAFGQYYSDVTTDEIVITNAPQISLDSDTGDVTITAQAGATIYYTTNGSTPTTESPQYSGPINIVQSTVAQVQHTVKALAVLDGQESAIATGTYTQIAAPSGRGSLNTLSGSVDYTLSSQVSGTIRYTTDGSTPTPQSEQYKEAITYNVFDAPDIKCYQTKEGFVPSGVAVYHYGAASKPDAPAILFDEETNTVSFELAGNTVDIPLQTNNNTPELGARIYYTIDGTIPPNGSGTTLWDGNSIQVKPGTIVKAITHCYGRYYSNYVQFVSPDYLCFETLEENNNIGMSSTIDNAPNIEYSLDGINFSELPHTTSGGTHSFQAVSLLNVGDKVYFRGVNQTLSNPNNNTYRSVFSTSKSCIASGSVQTLVDKSGTDATAICMQELFSGTKITRAPLLTARFLTRSCYKNMFANCSLLTESPSLQSKNLEAYCYAFMFQNCYNLTSAPSSLPATKLKDGCYLGMFSQCRSLASAPDLPATEISISCYFRMFADCVSLVNPPDELPALVLKSQCYQEMFSGCTSLSKSPDMPAETMVDRCYWKIFEGCRFLMSDNASTFAFDFGATLPQTVSDGSVWPMVDVTYSTPRDVAVWMGNLCGFDYMVPESALADDVVARIFKDNETGVLKYFPQSTYDASKFFADQYTEKDWMRQERNRDGITVLQRKTGIAAAKYAEDNRYKLYCDTTANGGFTIETGSWGSVNTQTIAWNSGDTLDDIVALFTSDSYVRFSHVQGEDFIRVLASQSSSSYECTLSNNTGGTVVDLSKQCRVGGIPQAETHRVWQGTDLHTMFPDAGIPAANTIQYAKSGLNLSHRCGGNPTTYMNYYEVSGSGHGGVDTYLAEDAVSARMSRVGFASCNGSGNPDAQALYDKYDGSWEAYMEASMIDGESTNANGIVDQTYSVADTVSPFLASVETADFTGEWIPAFPIFYNAYQVVDADFGHGIVGANHDISVYMDVDTMTQLNAGGCNISRTSYYWSVSQYDASNGWVFYGSNGAVNLNSKCNGYISARVLAYIRPS
jgi:hypothetical protein